MPEPLNGWRSVGVARPLPLPEAFGGKPSAYPCSARENALFGRRCRSKILREARISTIDMVFYRARHRQVLKGRFGIATFARLPSLSVFDRETCVFREVLSGWRHAVPGEGDRSINMAKNGKITVAATRSPTLR